MRTRFVLIIAAVVFALDQAAKYVVRQKMQLYQSENVLGDFFRLTYTLNEGIAFGLEIGGRWLLAGFTIAAIFFLLYYIIALKDTPPVVRAGLGLILGGAFGNLFDRIVYGKVVDFFDFDFPDFLMDRWPIFNIADSAVSVGITILAIYLVLFSTQDDTTDAKQTAKSGSSGAGSNKSSGFTETDQRTDRSVPG